MRTAVQHTSQTVTVIKYMTLASNGPAAGYIRLSPPDLVAGCRPGRGGGGRPGPQSLAAAPLSKFSICGPEKRTRNSVWDMILVEGI